MKYIIKRVLCVKGLITPTLARGGWAVVEAVTIPILMLALSPWLLSNLGAEGFGQWTFANTFIGFANMTSLGAGVSTMLAVANESNKSENAEYGKLIKSGLVLASFSGIVLVSLAFFLSPYISVSVFQKMGTEAVVSNIITLGIATLAIHQTDEVLNGAMRGMQRFDMVAKAEIIIRPLWAVVIAFVAYKTKDIIFLLRIHLFCIVVRMIFKALVVKRLVEIKYFRADFSICHMNKIIRTGKWISLQSVGGVMFSTMDKLFVGWIFGGGDLAKYAICKQIAQFVHNIQSATMQVASPWVARNKNLNLLKISIFGGAGCLAFPAFITLCSWWILENWIGLSFAEENTLLLVVLMLSTLLAAATLPAHYILLGIGKAKECAFILLVGGVGSLIASFVLSMWGMLEFSCGRLLYGLVAMSYFVILKQSESKKIGGGLPI